MRILSIVAIAAFVVAGTAGAADDKPVVDGKVAGPAAGPIKADGGSDVKELQVGMTAQVFGKVTSIHNVAIVGITDPHVLVKLESSPGNVEIVDLGSAVELKSNGIEPKEGQQLWVDGQVGKINDKPIVVADSLSESKMVYVTRQAPLREESTKHADARQADAAAAGNDAKPTDVKDAKAPKIETVDAEFRTIEGSVVHTRKVKIEGETSEHILAKVQTEDGIVVLDLGTCTAMPPTVDLTAGKVIAASGMAGHLNGKPIIVAETVGNQSTIQRPDQAENAPIKSSATDNATTPAR